MLAEAKGIERLIRGAQQGFGRRAALQMCPMCAPCCDHLIGPSGPCKDGVIILWPHWIGHFAHLVGVSFAPREDIGDLKRAKPKCAGPTLAPFDCRVILHLGRLGWVQHDKKNPLAAGVPCTGQGIAVFFAVGIDRRGRGVVFDMRARDHLGQEHAGWLHFAAAIGANGDRLAFVGGPNLFTIFDV